MSKVLCCLFLCLCFTELITTNALSQDFYWRDYIPGDIPPDALLAAEGRYIGQVNHQGNLPATIYPHSNEAVTTYGSKVIKKDPTIKIFCTSDPDRFYWEKVNFKNPPGTQMRNAVRGGFQFNIADYLYIGRAFHEDAVVQDFYWRDYVPGYIPSDALKAAEERYIGQVNILGYLPATIYPHSDEAVTTYGGKRIIKDPSIKILCTSYPERFYWELVNFSTAVSTVLNNAVRGGYENTGKTYLYIGKVFHEGEWKISAVYNADGGYKGFWVWDVNKEDLRVNDFYLLKYNYTTTAKDNYVTYTNK